MKMKLGHRNLFYSMTLAGIMLLFLVGYFVYMLPSLYVEYATEQNLKAIKKQHRAYVENGNYNNVQVKNPTACFSIKIPDKGNSIFITGKLFSAEVKMKDERLKKIFEEIRGIIRDYQKNTSDPDSKNMEKQITEKREEWESILKDTFADDISLPVDIQLLENSNPTTEYSGEYQNTYIVSDNFFVVEAGIDDHNNKYVNYIAIEKTKESLVISFLPVVTPDMNEIRPVVLQSLPMLGVVIFLLVLLFSQVYSKGIVTPVVRLLQHTQQMKQSSRFQVLPMEEKLKKREDEIGTLTVTIEELYQKIKENYEELEEEIQRQEILLKASSHQLKTPVSAALLLVDGMKNKIGKYKDTEKYLPKVKEQLLSMKKMIEDILYLNHCGQNLDFQNLELMNLLENQLSFYHIAITEKHLNICVEGLKTVKINTDEAAFSQILESILSNAVKYTPEKESIRIVLHEDKLVIQNFGVQVDSDILPHIFEPFVSGSHEKKDDGISSHGLGLYIAAYYAKKMGITIKLYNDENSVVTILYFFDVS